MKGSTPQPAWLLLDSPDPQDISEEIGNVNLETLTNERSKKLKLEISSLYRFSLLFIFLKFELLAFDRMSRIRYIQ